jgi:hypothetical protein
MVARLIERQLGKLPVGDQTVLKTIYGEYFNHDGLLGERFLGRSLRMPVVNSGHVC